MAGLLYPRDAFRAHILFHLIHSLHLWLHRGQTRNISFSRTGSGKLRDVLNALLCRISVLRQSLCLQTPSAFLAPTSLARSPELPRTDLSQVPSTGTTSMTSISHHVQVVGAANLITGLLRRRLSQFRVAGSHPATRFHPLQPQLTVWSQPGQSKVRKQAPRRLPRGHQPCPRALSASLQAALEKKGLETAQLFHQLNALMERVM